MFWFEKYILGGLIYEQLASWSGYSIRKLEYIFHHLLSESPPTIDIPELTTQESYLLVDGLWFGKRYALMLYRHHKRKSIIHASFVSKEFGSLIAKDMQYLSAKYRFTGIVSDGGTGIRNAVFKVFGNIPHQICMAHLHRDIINAAVRILVSLPDTSFKFLDHPLMPKTTNELEGSISVLSRKHHLHKGLKRERVESFLHWFIYFYNRKILS